MRHDKITAAPATRLQPRIFTCTCCETIEHRTTDQLPHGWEVEVIDGREYAFCTECKIDLPGHHMPAGATATRLGITSQLDATEMVDLDEHDLRYARMLAAIGQGERIGRRVLSMLIVGIVVVGSGSAAQLGARWIMM